jgi:transcriptional regulator with XRE-family HTH domain
MVTDLATKEIMKRLGYKLREIRNGKGLKIWSVEYATKISKSTISKIENGNYNFNIGTISKLASFYNVSLTDIITVG